MQHFQPISLSDSQLSFVTNRQPGNVLFFFFVFFPLLPASLKACVTAV